MIWIDIVGAYKVVAPLLLHHALLKSLNFNWSVFGYVILFLVSLPVYVARFWMHYNFDNLFEGGISKQLLKGNDISLGLKSCYALLMVIAFSILDVHFQLCLLHNLQKSNLWIWFLYIFLFQNLKFVVRFCLVMKNWNFMALVFRALMD